MKESRAYNAELLRHAKLVEPALQQFAQMWLDAAHQAEGEKPARSCQWIIWHAVAEATGATPVALAIFNVSIDNVLTIHILIFSIRDNVIAKNTARPIAAITGSSSGAVIRLPRRRRRC